MIIIILHPNIKHDLIKTKQSYLALMEGKIPHFWVWIGMTAGEIILKYKKLLLLKKIVLLQSVF
ncbi:hypothetical protein C8C85_1082 [Flavobacterium sp. 103]|nr:hypothetical protein C8C85_1082 [Flavobacterium sp. 103]